LRDRGAVRRLNTLRRRKSRTVPIHWMPASLYQPHWRRMRTFCLPSYYDGRVRINLCGRERCGVVQQHEYEAERDRIIQLLAETRDTVTGQPVVRDIEIRSCADALGMGETDADVVFVWGGAPSGFRHPRLGQIGPIPYRRTGGHTGGPGFAYLAGTPLAAGDYGPRSAFDVVPTLLDLLGAWSSRQFSGVSLLGSRVA
jgi:predicted AlkP superfamily phosphohydrolase/phosphomutase